MTSKAKSKLDDSCSNRIKQLETKLSMEQNNFHASFEANPMGMLVVGRDNVIMHANAAFLHKFKRDLPTAIGSKFGNSLVCVNSVTDGCGNSDQCGLCAINRTISQVLRTGTAVQNLILQKTIISGDQEVKPWYKISFIPISMDGEILVLVVLDDITELKRSEENLQKSRDFYLTMFDSFPAMVWRAMDYTKTADYFNQKWLDFTGRSLAQEKAVKWLDNIHPDDVEKCQQVLRANWDLHRSFELEYRLQRYDGLYRWVRDTTGPIYDLAGQFAGYIGVCRDITERIESAEVLKRYQVVLEKAQDIILFMDLDGQIIDANEAAAKAYGYSRDELLTRKIFDIRADKAETIRLLHRAVVTGVSIQTTHYRKDGSSFPVDVNSNAVEMGERQVIVSIIRDISEQKLAEAALQREKDAAEAANRAKSEFLANMSHEIRTPLNGVVGMIDLTLASQLQPEQNENLQIAKTCANSLLNIINDILDFSKMEAGKLVIQSTCFNIKEVIEEIVKTHAPRISEKGLELNYSFSAAVPDFLTGDPLRLTQVLNNIINNAIKFTDEGEILVTVKQLVAVQDELELRFAVSDTGIGVSDEDKAKLFKSFSQLDSSFTRKAGGTGLGLAISKQLVELMGGRIWVKSNQDAGTTFYFTIRCKVCHKPEVPVPKLPSWQDTHAALHILLVEDSLINQTVVSKILTAKGNTVEIAANGVEAVDKFVKNHYDLIFMDIQMPELNGIEATKQIRSMEHDGQHIPIIALTAHALQGDREHFLSFGMDDYVAKPINLDELFAAMDRVGKAKKLPVYTGVKISPDGEIYFTVPTEAKQLSRVHLPTVEKMTESINGLAAAVSENNLGAVEHIAHTIKRVANEIEDDELKSMAFKIELASRRGNQLEIMNLTDQIKYAVATLKAATLQSQEDVR
ncbi:MAG: PAS domain S-box protein [Peptococcaceae bacterium]|nr:PAS domain S-box protein [Peptococcaceae bacterium]